MGGITKRGSVWLRKGHGRGRIRRHSARRPDRGDLSKTGRPHRSHEGKGRHSQADARIGLGDARQRHRVQNPRQGVRQTEVPENKAHRRIPELGHVVSWAGRAAGGGVSPPLHKRGAAQRPLSPPQACQNTILAATVRRVRHKIRGNAIPRIRGNSQWQLRTALPDPRVMPAGTGADAVQSRKTRVWPCRIRCGHDQNVQDRTEHTHESLKDRRTNPNWTEPDAIPAHDIDGFVHP